MKFDRKEFLTRIAHLEEKIEEDYRKQRRELRGLYDYVAEIDEVPDFASRETYQEEPDSWLAPKQVCERLNISYTTFFEYVRNGSLPHGREFSPRVKRWRMSDIKAWQEEKQNGATVNVIVNEPPRPKRRGRPSKIRRKEEFYA